MKKFSKTVSGLDIQREYMSVAQYSAEENAVLLVAIQPLSLINGESIGRQLKSELKELKSKFKFSSPDIICSIPSEHAVLKQIKVDAGHESLDEALEWELSQQVLGSIDDYVYDFQETGLHADDASNYLAVAYRKGTVFDISTTLKDVRLNPLVVDLDIFALMNVFEANYPEKIGGASVLVHGENERTKLVLTYDGSFIDYDTFEYGQGSFDTDSYFQKVKSEIDKLVAFNNKNFTSDSLCILYTGALFSQPSFADSMIAAGGELLDPFRKIGCRVGISEEQLKTYSTQLAVAVGLAFRGND